MRLADHDEEGMQLVEERGIRRQMRLQECARRLVPGARRDQPVARQHASRIGVGHEDGTARRIQQDRVDGLGTEARHGAELGAQGREGRPTDPVEPPAEPREEPACEVTETARLQPVGARAADDAGKRGLRHGEEPARIEEPARAQRRDGTRRVRPRRVLREHGPGGDLVRAAARPPALRAEAAQEASVQAQQSRLDRITRWAGNPAPTRRASGDGGSRHDPGR